MEKNKKDEEVVPGLSIADVEEIADQVFNRKDGNHPQLNASGSGFINILKNEKPDISASSAFIKKVNL